MTPHPPVSVDETSATCGGFTAFEDDGLVRLAEGDPGSLEAVRAVTALAWSLRDRSGRDVQVDGTLGS